MTIGKFTLQLIAKFPELGDLPIVDLVPVVQPLFAAYMHAKSGGNEINELQVDRS